MRCECPPAHVCLFSPSSGMHMTSDSAPNYSTQPGNQVLTIYANTGLVLPTQASTCLHNMIMLPRGSIVGGQRTGDGGEGVSRREEGGGGHTQHIYHLCCTILWYAAEQTSHD